MEEKKMMQLYLGTKLVNMAPMNRKEYIDFRGWDLPADEDGADEGYLVEYIDGGQANIPGFDGYVSWTPKDVAERNYRPIQGLTFGLAIEAAKMGKKIARRGWNGKGMWVVLMPALSLPPYSCQEPGAKVNDRTAKHIGPDAPLDSQPYFVMWTALGQWQPGWLASQADMLAEDWGIVE